jgi:hypothetical protein
VPNVRHVGFVVELSLRVMTRPWSKSQKNEAAGRNLIAHDFVK